MDDNHSKARELDINDLDKKYGNSPIAIGGRGVNHVSLPPGVSKMQVLASINNAMPHISDAAMKAVSPYRADYIAETVERSQQNNPGPRANLGNVQGAGKTSLLKKEASNDSISGSLNLGGSSNTVNMGPNLYSPLFLTANMQLPRDRINANAWNRAYYETNPIVRNAINLHATYPISKINIKCKHKKIEEFYLAMAERIDLTSVVQNVALELWKLGEAFPYATLDPHTNMWDNVYLHNPDYISVKSTPIPGVSLISLQPDPELKKVVHATDPISAKLREKLEPRIIDHVIKNEYIPLDEFNITHLKFVSSSYDVRGTSIITSVWKDLVLWDKFREAKLAQADSMVNPLTLVKVGSSTPDGHYPRAEDLSSMREAFEMAQYDHDFKIFTHPDVTVERIGYSGGVLDITGDLTFITDNLFMGLMTPKSILTQEGATYASASVALDVMRQRYENFRTMISNWLVKKIFAPIAELNNFYDRTDGKKHLILPEIEWNRLTLYDMDTYIQHLMDLLGKAPTDAPTGVSMTTMYRSLGLDYTDELNNQKKEAIQMAILKKEMEEIKGRSLSELRAMDPMKPILESEKPALPGQVGPDAAGGIPDMSGGAPPDLGLGAPPTDAPPPGLDMGGGAPPAMS